MQLVIDKVFINDKMIIDNIDTVIQDDATMLEVQNKFAQYCEPYVPLLTGVLSSSGLANVTPQGVTYDTPYATYQYYLNTENRTRDFHPLATSFWDKVMLRDRGEEFAEAIRQILVRRLNG